MDTQENIALLIVASAVIYITRGLIFYPALNELSKILLKCGRIGLAMRIRHWVKKVS